MITLLRIMAYALSVAPAFGFRSDLLSSDRVARTRSTILASSESNFGETPAPLGRRSILTASAAFVSGTSACRTSSSWAAVASPIIASKIPTITLEDTVAMPQIALNTAGLSADVSERAFRMAISAGITHVDFHPGAERDGVAQVLRFGNVDRNSVFLTTKIKKARSGISPAAAAAAVREQIDNDLAALGVKSVDLLMLRDHPDCAVMLAQWEVLEESHALGKAKSLGVVNFCEGALRCLLEREKPNVAKGKALSVDSSTSTKAYLDPAVNYIMLHAGMGPDAHGLRSFGESRGVKTFVYGGLGEPGPSSELVGKSSGALPTQSGSSRKDIPSTIEILERVGASHGSKSSEEVALRWALQIGCAALSVRPTSSFGLGSNICPPGGDACFRGLEKRSQLFDWKLTEKELAEISALSSPDGNPTLFSSSGCPGAWGSI